MLNVALVAAELGEEEHGIFRFMNELDSGRVIHTERHSAGTQLIRYSFPIPAWLLNINTSVKSDKSSPLTSYKLGTGSSSSPSFELFDDTNQPEQQPERRRTRNHFDQNGTRQSKSHYIIEDCYKYALACQQAGQRIKSPYRLAKALHRTGEQGEEIALFLATGREQDHANAA